MSVSVREVPIEEVKVGDVVWIDGFSKWQRVTYIEDDPRESGIKLDHEGSGGSIGLYVYRTGNVLVRVN